MPPPCTACPLRPSPTHAARHSAPRRMCSVPRTDRSLPQRDGRTAGAPRRARARRACRLAGADLERDRLRRLGLAGDEQPVAARRHRFARALPCCMSQRNHCCFASGSRTMRPRQNPPRPRPVRCRPRETDGADVPTRVRRERAAFEQHARERPVSTTRFQSPAATGADLEVAGRVGVLLGDVPRTAAAGPGAGHRGRRRGRAPGRRCRPSWAARRCTRRSNSPVRDRGPRSARRRSRRRQVDGQLALGHVRDREGARPGR